MTVRLKRLLADWRDRDTHRRVWALAAPMIVSNITVPLVALTDSTVAGHLSHASQLAAVTVGNTIYQLPVLVCGFLRMGTVGFSAQACGRGDGNALRRILVQALLLALVLATTIGLLLVPFLHPVLALMKPSSSLLDQATGFVHVRFLGLPAALANYALAGWFLGSQNARVTVQILVLTNLVNIGLNLVFVLGLGWGIHGIALASALGEWSGCLFGLSRIHAQLRAYPGRLLGRRLTLWAEWKPLLAVNRDILIRSVALQGVFFAVVTLGARMGDAVVAANALLLNGLMLAAFALDGLANAVEALTGHAIGSRQHDQLRRAIVVAGGWSLVGSVLFALLFGLFGRVFVDMQTSIDSVRSTADVYLPCLAVLPLVAFLSYFLDGLFIGATRAREMRDAMLIAGGAFTISVLLLRPLGNLGLWLALLLFMLVRGGVMAWMGQGITRRDEWITPQRAT
ncbi:MATE family efflux transporter [Oleiagrimonas sp.]|uniref:MATE family efflux transporter n=1 Tax=Oleiagrimonas sp. TaxID=2010330 RepID=UPI00261B0420|nr:MATE family efflux transporter [Oleiagrimonas sp.]MDA3915329.1 MATE family efflux transporter [Oleiagrimonas sp.]